MTTNVRPLLVLAAAILLIDRVGAGEPIASPTIAPPTENKNAIARLRATRTTWTIGETIRFEYQYRRKPALNGEDLTKMTFDEVGDYFNDHAQAGALYNPWLRGHIFPRSGFIAVFDEQGRFRGPVLSDPGNPPRNADDRDWFQIDRETHFAIEFEAPTLVDGEDKSRTTLPVGKWQLQACLARRYFLAGNIFDAARLDVLVKRDPLTSNDPVLTPKQRNTVPMDHPELAEFLRTRLAKFLDPKHDEIVFRSNILEIEVVPEAKPDGPK